MEPELIENLNKIAIALINVGERLLKLENAINLLTMKLNTEELKEEEEEEEPPKEIKIPYKIPKLPFSKLKHFYDRRFGS